MDDDLHCDLIKDRQAVFEVVIPTGGWRRVFPKEYVKEIQPIAETLAVMAGVSVLDYEAFLQEADAIFKLRKDQPGEFSWIELNQQMQEDPVMADLWNKLQVLLALKGKEDGNV